VRSPRVPVDSRGRLSLRSLCFRLSVERLAYAVLRGRMVKSRSWVRMLDICIAFS
jgi:hypothetical protein